MLLNRKGMRMTGTLTLYCWRIPWRDYGRFFTKRTRYSWASPRAGGILSQQTTFRRGISATSSRSQMMTSRCTPFSSHDSDLRCVHGVYNLLQNPKVRPIRALLLGGIARHGLTFFTYHSIDTIADSSFPNPAQASASMLQLIMWKPCGSAVWDLHRTAAVDSDWWTFGDLHPRNIEVRLKWMYIGWRLHVSDTGTSIMSSWRCSSGKKCWPCCVFRSATWSW